MYRLVTKHISPRRNLLLNGLPSQIYARLRPCMELKALKAGDMLYESGNPLEHVYFPVQGIVSLLYLMRGGKCAEIAIVGYEGLIGISLFMGGSTTSNRAVVQTPGYAYRLSATIVRYEFENDLQFQRVLLHYTQALLEQTAQTAICNRHHSTMQQLCRWLLLSFDRVRARELHMTQELIANMLGVRREGVAQAASELQKCGIIHYARGRIQLLDREGLENAACDCYDAVKQEYHRLLPDYPHGDPYSWERHGDNTDDTTFIGYRALPH